MNSRVAEVLNRIELIAKKLEMSVEDAISILEGKHPTHVVVQKYKEVENPTTSGPADAQAEVVSPQAAATIGEGSSE